MSAALPRLERRGALKALLALRVKAPLNASAFTRETGLERDAARVLRQFLEAEGLLASAVQRRQGDVEVLEIGLTPKGRALADLLAQADAVYAGGPLPDAPQESG